MGKYRYKIQENPFKVGSSKDEKGIRSTVTNVDPVTGTVSWGIESTPAIDSTFKEFTELKNFIKKLDQDIDDPVITDIKNSILTQYNKYRTHIRKNYPEVYKRSTNEISTSGGAGGYLTKYAFKLPKGHKKIKEDVGANLGPGPKAGPKGVKNNYYVTKFGYKLVDRKKQAKASKAVDYKDLWGKTYN